REAELAHHLAIEIDEAAVLESIVVSLLDGFVAKPILCSPKKRGEHRASRPAMGEDDYVLLHGGTVTCRKVRSPSACRATCHARMTAMLQLCEAMLRFRDNSCSLQGSCKPLSSNGKGTPA